MRFELKPPLAALLSGTALLLAACGGTGAGLIPAGNAGPLRTDFETVAKAAEDGNGNCAATQAAIEKTEGDFGSLPASVSSQLRNRLSEGIDRLRSQALLACKQPSAGATTTATVSTPTTSSASTATSSTSTTSTSAETNTATSSNSSSPNGGTPAEGGEEAEAGGAVPPGKGPGGEGPPGQRVEHGGVGE